VLVKKAADREWKATDYQGIERSLFRNNDTGGRSSVVRLMQASRFPRHAHRRRGAQCRRLPIHQSR
jgi:hypothetical protein